jgi:hypothetical protein
MLKRFRRHLSPPTVVSTIALFVALGGGYAMAFSGSGSLQKGARLGIPFESTDIRTLSGIGSIQARCRFGDFELFFKNTSGKQLRMIGQEASSGDVHSGSTTGDLWNDAASPEPGTDYHQSIAPTDGSKAPQASVEFQIRDANDCSDSRITVLALNTQQP